MGLTDFRGNLYFGEGYAFECLGCFCFTDGNFMDFAIFEDYIAHPRCMGF